MTCFFGILIVDYNLIKISMKKAYSLLSLKQVDEKLLPLKMHIVSRPSQGWIQYIRKTLSLPASGLAKLLKMQPQSILDMEKNEQNKKTTLETLERAANALGCDLVYMFVPKTSMEDFVAQKKKEVSQKMVFQTRHTMILEEQGLNDQNIKDQQKIIESTLDNDLSYLWKNL